MPKNNSITGPIKTQPVGCVLIFATPSFPTTSTVGKVNKSLRPTQNPTRVDAVRVAKAKITRRNSLRKQREALKG